MAGTQAQLDALDTAIASGVLTVTTSDGRTVTYRNMAEMMEARRFLADSLTTANRQPASFLGSFRRDS